ATKEASKGVCHFCKGEFEKAKMTQHLKYCKQRATEIANELENTPASQKTRLFHILIEGRYNPQYWMHVEMSASDTLEDLDYFLRDIWLECCAHLSEFTIGGTSYSSEPEDYFYFAESATGEEMEIEEEEEEEEFNIDELLQTLPPEYIKLLPKNFLSELRKFETVDDLVTYLKETLLAIPKKGVPHSKEEWDEYQERYFQSQVLEALLEMVEDRSLDIPLEKLLKVGQKFFYEYDFGSSTELSLKVVSEREGVIQNQDEAEDDIEIIARNIEPVMLCKVCGKPAKFVVAGYFNVEENAFCSRKCVKKSGEDVDMLLPVVNSPRVGVCAYTGED
ncbi:MAG TPA: hypothetical protein VE843_08230, partial [Ktedonobacteraceae bacterium]|nr:hypothetical protein [Ktedonobacteraceae bacterium]